MNEQVVSNRTHWKWRIGLSIGAGLLVALVALGSMPFTDRYAVFYHAGLVGQLQKVDRDIKAFRARHHRLPGSLEELPLPAAGKPHSYDGNRDEWNRPFIYTVEGDTYFLGSYGLDGKPGGFGEDRDLTPGMTAEQSRKLTLFEALSHPQSTGSRFAAAVCGGLTFLLTLWALRRPDFAGPGIGNLVIKLVITLFCSSFVALIVAALHEPSGH